MSSSVSVRRPRGGIAARANAIATALLLVDTVLWAVHLAIRPPCPENYVRLLDVSPAVPYATGFLALLAAGLWFGSRVNESRKLGVEGAVGIVFAAIGGVLLLVVLAVLGSDGQPVSQSCWTF